MRAVAVCLLCMVAGCYSPALRDCDITCLNGTCPSGFECRDNVCREPGVTSQCTQVGDASMEGRGDVFVPTGDDDADGIDNAVDNCRTVPNPDQDNEDSDTFGDVCDLCPAVGSDNSNTDGDGVGNGCDPNEASQDSIVMFDGLNRAPPGSASDGAAITYVGGQAVFNTGPNMASNLIWSNIVLPSETDRLHMQTSMHIVGYHMPPFGADARGGGAAIQLQPVPNARYVVCARGLDANTTEVTYVAEATSASDEVFDSHPSPAQIGAAHYVQLTDELSAGLYQCNGYFTTLALANQPTPRPALHARDAHVKFDYLFIIKQGN